MDQRGAKGGIKKQPSGQKTNHKLQAAQMDEAGTAPKAQAAKGCEKAEKRQAGKLPSHAVGERQQKPAPKRGKLGAPRAGSGDNGGSLDSQDPFQISSSEDDEDVSPEWKPTHQSERTILLSESDIVCS